jgi:hypothetical protein
VRPSVRRGYLRVVRRLPAWHHALAWREVYVYCADSGGRCVGSDWLSVVLAVNAPSLSRVAQLDSSLTRHNEALAIDPPPHPPYSTAFFLRLTPLCGEYMRKSRTVLQTFFTHLLRYRVVHTAENTDSRFLSFCFYFKTKNLVSLICEIVCSVPFTLLSQHPTCNREAV